MELIGKILTGLIAVQHLYILWLEMFAWTTRGPKAFKGFPADYFQKTKVLAANQGLYNGFLAMGLLWSLFIPDPAWSQNVACFFLICVITAGVYGGLSVGRQLFLIQAAPAMAALAAVLFI